MMRRRTSRSMPASRPRRRAFTLVELLVVMGVLLVLSVLTTISVGRIANDARLSSGTNLVNSVLGAARAVAVRDNTMVLVTFRGIWNPAEPETAQVTEAVVAKWTGRTVRFPTNLNDPVEVLSDVFLPVAGLPPRRLPEGIKVAGPRSDFDQDTFWITQPEYRLDEADRAVAVLFGPDGQLLTRNPNAVVGTAVQQVSFVDLDNDWLQDIGTTTGAARFWTDDEPWDEVNLNFVQFLAVYDERAARELYETSGWTDENVRRFDLSEFISQHANRITFNRYSGLVQ